MITVSSELQDTTNISIVRKRRKPPIAKSTDLTEVRVEDNGEDRGLSDCVENERTLLRRVLDFMLYWIYYVFGLKVKRDISSSSFDAKDYFWFQV